ncbi:MAG TPA: COR domain-containing protein [Ferruginibacter sp.]|jgi:internalin A|nr:COR domain-containing protein [Ferruginibacter sp.]
MDLKSKVRSKLDTARKGEWGLLELRNCGLTEIPDEIFDWDHLISIDLSNDDYCEENNKNRITAIPDKVSNLKKLARVNLSDNHVSEISENLSNLTKLEYLNLNKNKLTDLSAKIANMPKLKQLMVQGNPFEMIPPEIIARGIDSIRNFFKELEEKDYLYEAKLIIVGEGRVGKTCIAEALIDPKFKLSDRESTEGINISRWIIPKDEVQVINPKIQRDLQINIWDFGGQEIYHSTHQFFLTKRSVYMLVTESRKEDSHDDFFYWLNIIKLLGDKSPVLMVLNKCDQPTKELPIKEYKETFNNIIGFEKISLAEGFENTLANLKEKLITYASSLPHIGTPLPKKWVDIRIEIEKLKLSGKNYITEAEYLKICLAHYRQTDSALFLSEYFHDLGVLLHFQNDIDLKDTVILNHEWITGGVYKILDDRKVIGQNGKFNLEDINRIWSDEEYKYKIRELLSLMKNRKFDLCFELSANEYLVPRLLPVDEIDHNWESNSKNLKFEIHYKFMPKGILTRLIVKMNQDISNNMYWRYGVVLEYMNTKAIVREKYFENKISIELSGDYKREFLFMIRKSLNEIHKDYNKLKYQEMVPCVCKTCEVYEHPSFYPYDLLMRYEQNGKKTIVCPLSLEDMNVLHLTSNVVKGRLSNDRMIVCENKNADLLNLLKLEDIMFFPEKDSTSVFMQVKTRPQIFGLRDRDFLMDSEIEKIKRKYPNYYILDYYCFENYLYHPDNIDELKLEGYNKDEYIKEIVRQKNNVKNEIISNLKKSRDSYQEFKIELENLRNKADENTLFTYLESNDIEIFFKSYSMKSWFNKEIIKKYLLKTTELISTNWFKEKMAKLLEQVN